MKKAVRIVLTTFAAAAASLALFHAEALSEVRPEHPRIWLTPEFKATLINRLNENATNARTLVDWCDDHMNDDLSSYISGRALDILKSINYALLYQLRQDETCAQRAVEIIEYAFDHPYSSYTIDTWIDFDNCYTTRYLVPPVAIVLDWCYDYMSQDQRNAFMNQLDRWAARLMDADPWAWYDPSNNFYHGYTWALISTGYAMYGHHPNAQTYITQARDVMLAEAVKFTKGEQIAWPLWNSYTGRAKGGMWNEGTSYGCVNYDFMMSSILAVGSAEGIEYTGWDFPGEAIKFYIYCKHPSGGLTYSDGDGARGGVDATNRIPILLAIACAEGDVKRYGQFWIDTYTSHCTWGYKLYNEFLWYDDQLSPLDYDGIIPDHYYMDGTRILFWRENWDTDACWISFKIGILNTDHAHNGLGDFMIFKDGFLATDKACETGNTMLHSDLDHNVLYIPPAEDKKLYWGESEVEHLESNESYIYFAGDMSDMYLSQPDYRNNTVAHKEREFFLIKKEKVLAIMDRGTSYDSGNDKIFQIYLHNQAEQSGASYRSSNGNADLIIHTAHPRDAATSLDTYGAPRLRVTTAQSEQTKTFMHLLKVADPGGDLYAADVDISGANAVGAAFRSGTDPVDYMLAFSNDPEGDPITAQSFTLTYNRFNNTIRAYLMNLEPNTTYYVEHSTGGASATVTVSRGQLPDGEPHVSNGEGILHFIAYLDENELPLPPPSGVNIE